MDRKFSIVVGVAVVLILIGACLVITNPYSGEFEESVDSLKTQDLKLFKIDVPVGANFTLKNDGDGMKYYQNTGNHSDRFSSIIITKDLTDSLVGDNVESISNSTSQKIYSFDLKNKTNYKVVSIKEGADVILLGEDLNLLKEVSDTIEIKDVEGL